jgi:hypothetical protein
MGPTLVFGVTGSGTAQLCGGDEGDFGREFVVDACKRQRLRTMGETVRDRIPASPV